MGKNAVNSAVVSSTPLPEPFSNGRQEAAREASHVDLPADHPRKIEEVYPEGRHAFALSRELTAALKGLSGQEHVDLFAALLATFNILLARYGREVIELSVPIATELQGRADDGGTLCVGTVALGTCLSGDSTFRKLLCRLRQFSGRAGGRDDMRPKTVAILIQPDGDLTILPLRQVFFAMHKITSRSAGELESHGDRLGSETAASELRVFVWEEGERLEGVVAYNANLFDESTIGRLAGHYAALLTSVVDNPDQSIAALPLLTEAERQQLLVQWNETKSEYPEDLCVHQLFEREARNRPDAVAAIFGDQRMTYRELNDQANRVARDLRKLGVQADTLVGLCVERSLEMLVGILAALKAGGAYIPLDPNYPNKRLSAMLSEAQPRVLLTQRHLISRFPEYAGPVIVIDGELASGTQEGGDNLAIELTPESLAYVIFTSGSTGIPKGVLISHRSLVNHSAAMARRYELHSSDRVLQFASFGFDVAAEEIFPTWLSGATVVLWPAVAAVQDFLEFVEQHAITVLNLPASYWHEWVSESEQLRVPPSVRLVAVGSDKVWREKLSIWKQQIGGRVRLYNAYGPTEATITATIYDASGDSRYSMNGCVPIGRPVANTEAYVLDQGLNPVPIGVPGELHIGGIGLARGYLNQPELTAERFIANPFCSQPKARIYKTGDLVRYLPDGNLEYLGRIGHQAKLRGYRIELGEIEALLRQCFGVRDAAVTVREDIPGDERLVAYVIQKREGACTADELRDNLRERLPDYMVPSAFVTLNSFPLTSSGKVDRQALPAPDRRQTDAAKFVSPRNPIERRLAGLWEELLGARPIGIHDSFFNLGGNSLLGLKLISRIRKTFRKDIPVAALYRAGTVEQLAKLIIQPYSLNPLISLAPIQTSGSQLPFFWVHGDSSNAFLPRFLGQDQPLYGLMHQSQDGKPARYTEVESIAAHYLQEMRTVQAAGPYLLGGFSFGGTLAVEMARQLKTQGEEVSILFLLDPEFPVRTISDPCNRPKRVPFLHEARRHLRNLAPLGYRDKLGYILVRLRSKIKNRMQRFERIRRISKIILCKLYVRMGGPLPVFLRSTYILDIYGRALETYAPQSYPGPTIYCKVKNGSGDSGAGLEKLFTGKLSVQELDVDHLDLVEESGVPLWAEELKNALQAVQDTANDKKYQVSSQCMKK